VGWLSVAAALLKIVGIIADYLKNQQLIDAGKAEAIVDGVNHVAGMVDDAKKGADGMAYDPDWAQRVRDKYRKP